MPNAKKVAGSNAVDLTGMRFGYAEVVSYIGKVGENHLWKCRCDCGKDFIAKTGDLRSGRVTSCGCSKARKPYTKQIANFAWRFKKRTDLLRISKKFSTVNKNSKSGTRGVFYVSKSHLWCAKLVCQGKEHRVMCGNLELAIRARRKLEKMYFEPLRQ